MRNSNNIQSFSVFCCRKPQEAPSSASGFPGSPDPGKAFSMDSCTGFFFRRDFPSNFVTGLLRMFLSEQELVIYCIYFHMGSLTWQR